MHKFSVDRKPNPIATLPLVGSVVVAVAVLALSQGHAAPAPLLDEGPSTLSRDLTTQGPQTLAIDSANEGSPLDLARTVNEKMGLSSSTLGSLDFDIQANGQITTQATIDDAVVTIQMWPHSVRAANFQVRAQMADGSWVDVDPGPERTIRGEVDELPGSVVAGSFNDGLLYAKVILLDGPQYWIEPIQPHVPNAAANLHVIYSDENILATGASCGADFARQQAGAAMVVAPDKNDGTPEAGGLFITEMATDADVEYFQDYGSVEAVQARIALVTNVMNTQYESQVNITHVLTTMLVRTSEPDPYSQFGSLNLLCQFVVEWTNNNQCIQRDVAQLFTGRNVSGGVIGRAADIGSVCERQGCTTFPCTCGQFGTAGSYCFVQSDFNNNFGCATDLSAHELGHLWNAFHCNCPGNTMNPFITCTNNFSNGTIAAIIAYRNTRDCLSTSVPCDEDLDGNDVVGLSDLLKLLEEWGPGACGPPDFDGDGTVGLSDLLQLLAAWGPCP